MRNVRNGVVSVVLVNYKGTDDTLTSIEYLAATDWPAEQLEIIVVDNGSGEEYVAPLRASTLDFTLIETGANLGFTGGCNRGVSEASGEFIAFLNNDARPDSAWIRAAVDTFVREPSVGAVASKVLDWEGRNVDFTEAALTWYGMGYKPYAGSPDTGAWETERDVLFGTGAAMFMRANLFDELGGFDDRYFMFYDDVDLGWRMNLLGWRFRYQPASIAFHKHHASMKKFGEFRETYLLERNALFTLFKNLGDDELSRALPGAIALAVRRATARGELDSTQLDLRRRGNDAEPAIDVSKMAMAGIFAVDQFVELLPSLAESRRQIQASRRVTDAAILPLFGNADEPAYPIGPYLDGYARILAALDPLSGHQRRTILVDGYGSERDARSRAASIRPLLEPAHSVRIAGESADDSASGSTLITVRPIDGLTLDAVAAGHALIVDLGDIAVVGDDPVSDATSDALAQADHFIVSTPAGRSWVARYLVRTGRAQLAVVLDSARLDEWVSVVHGATDPAAAAGDAVVIDGTLDRDAAEHIVLAALGDGVPVIAIAGSAIADFVLREHIGVVASSGSIADIAAARASLDGERGAAIRRTVEGHRVALAGASAAHGLVDFCRSPTRAGVPLFAPPRPDSPSVDQEFAAGPRPRPSLPRRIWARVVPRGIRRRVATLRGRV